MKTVHFVPGDLTVFMKELLDNKKFCSTFGLSSDTKDISNNPTIQALVKDYKSSVDKEKKQEVRRSSLTQCIIMHRSGVVKVTSLFRKYHDFSLAESNIYKAHAFSDR